MKEPKGHYEDDYGDCTEDGEGWPCAKVRRWMESKDYKIQVLQSDEKRLTQSIKSLGDRLAKAEGELRHVVTTLKGHAPALHDLLGGRTGGRLEYKNEVEYIEAGSAGFRSMRVPGMQHFSVTYTDADGSVWKDGKLVEKKWRKT